MRTQLNGTNFRTGRRRGFDVPARILVQAENLLVIHPALGNTKCRNLREFLGFRVKRVSLVNSDK